MSDAAIGPVKARAPRTDATPSPPARDERADEGQSLQAIRTRRSLSGWTAIPLVTLIPLICWLACWPFVDSSVNDDFSYAHTVRHLSETGRFVYNGWSSAMLGAQAVWAVPFVRAFGFSHDVLRVSVLPLSMLCGILAYWLHRRLEIDARWSLFATLLLVTSPLFTPWSASFMSDVPGLVLTLALLHTYLSLQRATSTAVVIAWTAAVLVIGLMGGSVRQSLFVMTGVALAIELWRHRGHRVHAAVLAVGLISLGGLTLALVRWHAAQPYHVPELRPSVRMLPAALLAFGRLALDLALFALPLTAAVLLRIAPLSRRVVARTFAVALAIPLIGTWLAPEWTHRWLLPPWTHNTVTPTGLIEDWIDAPGHRPVILGTALRLVLAAGVWGSIVLVVLACLAMRPRWRLRVRDLVAAAMTPTGGLVLIAIVYCGLLVPRATFGMVFDRYLLVPLPIFALAVLHALRGRLVRGPGLFAYALLVLFALGGIVITADHFTELRARVACAEQLVATGIPRTAIVGGLNYDAWTQLEARGYLNDDRIRNPPGAYVPDPREVQKQRIYWLLTRTPAIEPRLVIANVRSIEQLPAGTQTRRFTTLLPPRERWLAIIPVDLERER